MHDLRQSDGHKLVSSRVMPIQVALDSLSAGLRLQQPLSGLGNGSFEVYLITRVLRFSMTCIASVLLSLANLAEGVAVHQAWCHEVPMKSLVPVYPASPR